MAKIVIDPGHGGTDPGTSANGIVEKDYTLLISQYMKKRLDELGIENSITRNTDETLEPTVRPSRAQSFYGSGDDVILVSNHINAGGGDGAEVIYALRNSDKLSSMISKELEAAGQNVRKYYQRRLPSNPAKDYYYILRDTPNNESIIVEYGFADSPQDDPNQIKNNYEQLTEAVVKALADYVGVTYTPPVGSNTYVVKSGDTLWSIARRFNTSVSELKSLNNLSTNALSINQVLKLPTKQESTVETYTVKSGDTLYGIANKFGLTVNELKSINNLSTNLLSIGQVLKLKPNVDMPNNTGQTYTVQRGDTLYAISLKYNVPVNQIKSANNLTSNLLTIGQVLKIPQKENQIYTVVAGDTLYNIARKNNTTVSEIIDLNNLSTSNLSIGQKLLIPN